MRVTRVEAAAVLTTLVVIGGAIGLFSRSASAVTDRETATVDARRVLIAAQSWREQSAAAGCPTLTLLKRDGSLEADARTDDAWGERFRVVCTGEATRVVSPGRDGKLRTDDDVVVESHGDS